MNRRVLESVFSQIGEASGVGLHGFVELAAHGRLSGREDSVNFPVRSHCAGIVRMLTLEHDIVVPIDHSGAFAPIQ